MFFSFFHSFSGTIVDNVGTKLATNASPMVLDATTLVFGAAGGGLWFNMVATDLSGTMKETRYIEISTVGQINQLTKALWDSTLKRRAEGR